MGAGDIDVSGALAARTAAAGSTESLARSLRDAGADEAAKKFEALFATMLVKEMRKALPEGFFGEGAGGDIYGGWFDEHLGGAIARTGALHLTPIVERGMANQAAARAYAASIATPQTASVVTPDPSASQAVDEARSAYDAELPPSNEVPHMSEAPAPSKETAP
jgi:Rod binding domain-containing protein